MYVSIAPSRPSVLQSTMYAHTLTYHRRCSKTSRDWFPYREVLQAWGTSTRPRRAHIGLRRSGRRNSACRMQSIRSLHQHLMHLSHTTYARCMITYREALIYGTPTVGAHDQVPHSGKARLCTRTCVTTQSPLPYIATS